MNKGTVFLNNTTQAVRLPADCRFPSDVKKVFVRVVGHERILSPTGKAWDSFFLSDSRPSDDFMTERDNAIQPEREAL